MAQEDQEFEESEIAFQDCVIDENNYYNNQTKIISTNYKKKKKNTKQKKSNSVPVNIPVVNVYNIDHDMLDEELYIDHAGRGEFVPPHLITSKRVDRNGMAFSVCTGNGRTLKGRDLREVRDSILRMTGFLET